MASSSLDQLLTSLAVRLHASSICTIQQGWALAYQPFDAVTVHFVLRGSGMLRIGNNPAVPFSSSSAVIVPAGQSHVLGTAGPKTKVVLASDHCSLVADGLVQFTAGGGRRDILLLCGMIPDADGHALSTLGLLGAVPVETIPDEPATKYALELMYGEIARPRLGTHAMAEVLMKQCLISIFRSRLALATTDLPFPSPLLHQPRLARAVLAVLEMPSLPHSVASLAALAGMSRASFAEHFSRAFKQTPIEFVQTVRLHIAARLLGTTDLPIKVIGQSVGYTAPAAFSRAFRARYNTDPQAYRATQFAKS